MTSLSPASFLARRRPLRVEDACIILLVAAGVFLRMRGIVFGPTIQLWSDEASWAIRMFERPLAEHVIRPPLFIIFTRIFVALLGNTELGFRFLPWCAGLATPFVAVLLARRAFRRTAARLMFIGVLSLSYEAIDLSKEFKPYAIGLLLQVLIAFLVLRWLETNSLPSSQAGKSRRDLLRVCFAAPIGLFFCQDVMFLFPGLFLVLLIETWRTASSPAKDRQQLVVVSGMCALTLLVVVSMYFLVWSRISKEQAEQHWGTRYDVFYLPDSSSSSSYPEWFARKYDELIVSPGDRSKHWVLHGSKVQKRAVRDGYEWAWRVLHVLGVVVLIRGRRWREALLFLSPLLVCGLFNFLGFWPLGAFRTDHFLLAGLAAMAAMGLDLGSSAPTSSRWLRALAVVPVLVLMVLPFFFVRHWHTNKKPEYRSGVLTLLEKLSELGKGEAPGQHIFLDTRSCSPFMYYTRYHPRGMKLWEPISSWSTSCENNRDVLFDQVRALPPETPAWMILRGNKGDPWPADLPVERRVKSVRQVLTQTRSPAPPP